MARVALFLLSLVLVVAATAVETPHSRTDAYIQETCAHTRYKFLCERMLTVYARKYSIQSPDQLARVAIYISLCRAGRARAYMRDVALRLKSSNGNDYQAIEGCLDRISDGVRQLGQADRELKRIVREFKFEDLGWHLSNVQTWMSSALTDARDCVILIEGSGMRTSKMKAGMKVRAMNVAEVTSNALALFQKYTAARYRAMAAAHKP